MALELVFTPNPIQERDPRLAHQFEHVVAEALRGQDALGEGGTVQVRFHLWDGEDLPRYVCKVECPGSVTLAMEEPPWRWWSGLVETPQELGQALREAVRARALGSRRGSGDRPSTPPAGRWGWAGEMQLT